MARLSTVRHPPPWARRSRHPFRTHSTASPMPRQPNSSDHGPDRKLINTVSGTVVGLASRLLSSLMRGTAPPRTRSSAMLAAKASRITAHQGSRMRHIEELRRQNSRRCSFSKVGSTRATPTNEGPIPRQ